MKKTENKGITLIVLIITIIIMLILIAVVIDVVIDGKLIDSAKEAVTATNDKVAQTQTRVDELMGTLTEVEQLQCNHTYSNGVCTKCGLECEHTFSDGVCTKCGVISLPEGFSVLAEAPSDWDTTKVTPITDGTNNVPLPKGYSISEEDGEYTIDGGLVIKDSHNNEFVWIPVAVDLVNPYTNSSFSEPKVLTYTYSSSNAAYDSQETLDYLYGENYFNYANDFKYSDEYADMVASVNKYDGFYVGRYETTIDSNGNIGSVENTPVLTPDQTMFTKDSTNYPYRWYGMYYAQKTTDYIVGNEQNVQSAMIYGQLWDKVMAFVNGKTDGSGKNTFNINSQNSLRHTGLKANSGQNNNDLVANIYDLEGNCYDWTQEAYSTYERVKRRRLLQR